MPYNYSEYARNNRVINPGEALEVRSRAASLEGRIGFDDHEIDSAWARYSADQQRPNDYFDYYFSGQDIRVRVAEIPDSNKKFGDLPIMGFAFNVQQEKQPLYGFWSYTYDAVMRGTRIIQGAFTIATKYPNYMRDLIAEATRARQNASMGRGEFQDRYSPYGVTEDDRLINEYWNKNLDPSMMAGANHVFSVHPPFSFVIIYGMQNVSVDSSYDSYYKDHYDARHNALLTDHNHRLVEANPDYNDRIILDAVELQSCQREFTPDGTVLNETYTFFARDIVHPTSTSGKAPARDFRN